MASLLHARRASRLVRMPVRRASGSPIERLRAGGLEPAVLSEREGALVYLVPDLFPAAEASALFDFLATHVSWRRETDDFGPQQRLSTFWADPLCTFAYVGLTLRPRSWPEPVAAVRKRLDDTVGAAHGASLTACLANNYPENEGSIPWHADEVRAHGEQKVVAVVSLGGTREMQIRPAGAGERAAPA